MSARSMKRGGESVYVCARLRDRAGGMDGERGRGKVCTCVCGRQTWLERYIDRCVSERGRWRDLERSWETDLKKENVCARWRECRVGSVCAYIHAREKVSAS